jgi:hypothetical protein
LNVQVNHHQEHCLAGFMEIGLHPDKIQAGKPVLI